MSTLPARGGNRRLPVEVWSVALAMAALALGAEVYLADRPAGHAMLVPSAVAFGGLGWFGPLGAWLPSFLHPFAFSLLTAAACPPRAAPAYGACAAWWAVNVAFEILQLPELATSFATAIEQVFGHGALAQALAQYALRGTFDAGDLVAATAGALAAAGVLFVFHRREIGHAC